MYRIRCFFYDLFNFEMKKINDCFVARIILRVQSNNVNLKRRTDQKSENEFCFQQK